MNGHHSGKKALYRLTVSQAKQLFAAPQLPLCDLSNAAALLFTALPDINWAGFYILRGEELILGPFQGKPACRVIPLGRGVCGTAAVKGETVTVEDVHAFPGHIACDADSRSEIVVPLFVNGNLFGVLDIDSPSLCRFDGEDRAGLEEFARVLEEALSVLLPGEKL